MGSPLREEPGRPGTVPPGRTDVAGRIRRWKRSGLPHDLWPDVSPGAVAHAHASVLEVTRTLMHEEADVADRTDGSAATRPALRAPDQGSDTGLRALGIAAFLSGMGPLLGRWIDDGVVAASAPVQALLARHLEHGRRRSALLRARAVELVVALRAVGVDPLLLKGLHTGAVYAPEPGVRPCADIDVLIRPAERSTAETALAAAGYVEERRTVFADRSEWRHRDAPRAIHELELEHEANPWAVDLHTGLRRCYFRGVRRDLGPAPLESSAVAEIDGEHVRVLEWPALLAFLALHASHDLVKTRLVRIVELVRVARAAPGDDAWSAVTGLVGDARAWRFVLPALELAERLSPTTIDPSLLEECRAAAGPRIHRTVAAVHAAHMAPLTTKSLDAKLLWADGPYETVLAASELLIPSDDAEERGPVRLLRDRLRTLVSGRVRWRSDAPPPPPLSAPDRDALGEPHVRSDAR